MAKITAENQYRTMQVGDILPNGEKIIRISRNTPESAKHSTTRLTTSNGKRETTFGAERSSETYGEAVARAEAMHRLEDHS